MQSQSTVPISQSDHFSLGNKCCYNKEKVNQSITINILLKGNDCRPQVNNMCIDEKEEAIKDYHEIQGKALEEW